VRVLRAAGQSSLIDVSVDEKPAVKVLVKEVQMDPLKTIPMHIDFQQVRMDEKLSVKVSLAFTGESKAVKSAGGTLVKSLDEVEVRCLPGNLPHEILVDISALSSFDDAIMTGDLKMPEGVELVTPSNITVATVEAPLTEEELKALEAAASGPADLSAIKTEGEEKKAADAAKKAEEEAAAK
jgi:large subunit ribosomal protein L25